MTNGAEQITPELRSRYQADEPFDAGEQEQPRFEDDGTGHCLHCRRRLVLHVGELGGPPTHCPIAS